MTFSVKDYVDKAVQTDDQGKKLGRSFCSDSGHSVYVSRGLGKTPQKSDSTDASSLSSKDEYSIVAQLGSNSSLLTASRIYNHPQTLCCQPIRPSSLNKRIVSLPERAPRLSCETNLAVPNRPSTRAVSLSALAPHLLVEPTNENECSGGLTDTSYPSSGDGSVHYGHRDFPPSGIPTTPSPPSSPESILIIGNNAHVPPSFFRQRIRSRNSIVDDDGGWITWATSPPKPIPALHGPLSLPYARCPSGAEGTIIEDADLPRMIWGLDLDGNGLAGSMRGAYSLSSKATSAKYTPSGSELLSPEVGSPSLRPIFNTLSSPVVQDSTRNSSTNRGYQQLGNFVGELSDDTCSNCVNNLSWGGTFNHIRRPLKDEFRSYQSLYGSLTKRGKMAPLSIPNDNLNRDYFVPEPLPPVEVHNNEPPVSYHGAFVRSHRKFGEAITSQHSFEQPITLPTPPNSSSPQWTPTFPTHACWTSRPPEQRFWSYQQHTSPDLYLDGPVASGRNFSGNVHHSTIECSKKQTTGLGLTDGIPLALENAWGVELPSPPIFNPIHSFPSATPITDSSKIRQQDEVLLPFDLKVTPEDRTPKSPLLRSQAPPLSSTSQIQRPMVQQLQSIPLARLIQRRLSSVAEEDGRSGRNSEGPSPQVLSHHRAFDYSVQNRMPSTRIHLNSINHSHQELESDPTIHKRKYQDTAQLRSEPIIKPCDEDTQSVDQDNNNFGSPHSSKVEKVIPKKRWRGRKNCLTSRPNHS